MPRNGRVVAALNASMPYHAGASRHALDEVLPELRATALAIERWNMLLGFVFVVGIAFTLRTVQFGGSAFNGPKVDQALKNYQDRMFRYPDSKCDPGVGVRVEAVA